MNLQKIISGGQTGADQGGLEAAEALGILTGGFIPKGFRTENGPRPDLAKRFDLVEHSAWGYPPRTRTNVFTSDMTICFGNIHSPGSKLTRKYCNELGKFFMIFDYPLTDSNEIERYKFSLHTEMSIINPKIINIAGNREGTNPGIQEFTRNTLIEVLKQYVG